ncbi:uncharacterized protein LOC114872407 isoform X2 [Osmia bicornis bicornis]|uniref:uncharacterized protein LOC114872407 isoform X2 n=1 Tax=Osmia bicornis bicornis TaxID=1437191 RepID=UPI001EAF79F7|nr:uncharacterized protein LOC114872407 isoform X2 [Osmia bicornis bicornis]XP_046143705.1 uncharacterized protein LOC114872407 isoform X2 [Osmia bicornis bicornis]XP_046143706.1 uncharacterized protein LOC114872407 isoform X2 [Osmia bicornis bicornis]XP_046143707.1 uncharacterized protein LOC114872407 isoform X2 [Osmia bicornis bicornis]XP_046143708.1 uncharacterized protein LOC114872407 isoform X2 [Osmia bicornis bicornis]XP_046143709.1 uncharacterized protein LOC114872407 isoform X2 [Osmia 
MANKFYPPYGWIRETRQVDTIDAPSIHAHTKYLCRFLIAILRYQGNLISSYHIFVLSVCPTRVLDIDWLHIAPMMKPEEDDASFGNEPKKSSVDATFIATMST